MDDSVDKEMHIEPLDFNKESQDDISEASKDNCDINNDICEVRIDEIETKVEHKDDSDSDLSEASKSPKKRFLRRRKKRPRMRSVRLPGVKRGRQDLPLREKMKIIETLDQDKYSQRMIADMYKVSQSQVCRIQNNKSQIQAEWKEGKFLERRRNRLGKGGILEEKLLDWYNEAKQNSFPINGPILIEKAKALAIECEIDFKATSGWFTRWKKRNGISLKGVKYDKKNKAYSAIGGGDSVGSSTAGNYTKHCTHWRRYTFTKATKGVDPEDIWYVGETFIYYNALKSFEEMDQASLMNLKSFRVILAFNSSGLERKTPLIIGNEKIPSKYHLPLVYYNNYDIRMLHDCFSKWFIKWDKELGHSKRKIVVFLQHSHFLGNLRLPNINIHYYPDPDPKEERMDHYQIDPFYHDVIKTFKSLFRYQMYTHSLANEIFSQNTVSGMATNVHPSADFTLLVNALHMLKRAWDHMNPDILVKGVVKAGLSKQLLTLDVKAAIQPPLGLSQEQFDDLVSIDDKIKKTISITSMPSTNITTPAISTNKEVLSACNIVRNYMLNKFPNFSDKFAEIESTIQQNIILETLCESYGGSQLQNPLYCPSSVYSKEGYENTLNKREAMIKEPEPPPPPPPEPVIPPPAPISRPSSTASSQYSHHNMPQNDNINKDVQMVNALPLLHHSPQPTSLADYAPNYATHCNPLPIGMARSIQSGVDRRFITHPEMQNYRQQIQDVSAAQSIHNSEVNNQNNIYHMFTSQF